MKLDARKVCNSCRKTVAVKRLIGYRTLEDYVTIQQHDAPCYYDDSQSKSERHYCSNCWSRFQRAVSDDIKEHSKCSY